MDKLSIADVLEKAADLIEPEGAWTQQAGSRDAAGRDPQWEDTSGPAVCWCAQGAISHVADSISMLTDVDAFVSDLLGRKLYIWNDAPERTQAEVVAKLREAAALAREEATRG